MKRNIHKIPRPKVGRSSQQAGFTIVELLIASAVFSVVLLLCAAAMLQIGRIYYKGVTTIRTQETARNIIEDISRGIQFAGGDIIVQTVPRGDRYVVCVGDARYSIVLARQRRTSPDAAMNQVEHVLVRDQPPVCSAADSPLENPADGAATGAQEMVPENMRLAKLEIAQQADNTYAVTVRVVSGEDDLLHNATEEDAACKLGQSGGQFCAVSELRTVVHKRL